MMVSYKSGGSPDIQRRHLGVPYCQRTGKRAPLISMAFWTVSGDSRTDGQKPQGCREEGGSLQTIGEEIKEKVGGTIQASGQLCARTKAPRASRVCSSQVTAWKTGPWSNPGKTLSFSQIGKAHFKFC